MLIVIHYDKAVRVCACLHQLIAFLNRIIVNSKCVRVGYYPHWLNTSYNVPHFQFAYLIHDRP